MASLEVNVRQASADFSAIKEKIVANGVAVAEGTRTSEYAKKIDSVYEAGKETAYGEFESVNSDLEEILYGRDTGGKGWWDIFWDDYQQNGKEVIEYTGAFAGSRWTKDTFKPKYDIVPGDANQIFWASKIGDDLAEHLENCGIKLDFSNSYTASSAFAYSKFTRIGEITLNTNRNYTNMFNGCSKLKIIDKITVADGANLGNAFNGCTSLESVIFGGIINKTGFSFQDSPLLSRASIESIINALSTTTTGLTITLSKTAVNKAFETSLDTNDGSTSAAWTALEETKKNWTISLA